MNSSKQTSVRFWSIAAVLAAGAVGALAFDPAVFAKAGEKLGPDCPMQDSCPMALAFASEASAAQPAQNADSQEERLGDPYPLAECPVSEMPLDRMGEPIIYQHDGREIRFCCEDCVEKFEQNAEAYISKIDEQIVEQQMPHYPMEDCPVSERELGSMGKPVDYVYHNRLVRLCCGACEKDLEAEPETHLQTLDSAVIAEQREDYPLDTCPVSGRELGSMGDPVELVVANRLVKLCCPGCEEDFEADPAEHLETIEEAEAADEAYGGVS